MSLISQTLRQPVVLGYLLSGVIIGPYTPPFQLVNDIQSIQTWAELGVIFLMFTLGLEFSFKKLLKVGATAVITATAEVSFFLVVGFFIGKLLGWNDSDSLFLGAMLSISSTTIIIKALEEHKLKKEHFSQLIFGILIVEDLLAVLLLVGLTSFSSTQDFSIFSLLKTFVHLILVVGSWFLAGNVIIPPLMSAIDKKENKEMLTLVSIALCLILVVFAVQMGYSAALGAFIMGSILAESKVIHKIEEQMMPLRDLFGAIFFVSIGMLIDPHVIWEYRFEVMVLCLVTIIGKIIISSFGAFISGQKIKDSLQVGFGLAQIGEFSFIIATLGVTLGVTSPKLYPIGVAVSLVTTFTTPYLIKYSSSWADKILFIIPGKCKNVLESYTSFVKTIRR
jgi:monovalent cation:H+ antiporter-2, CPA2 family